MKKKMLVMLLAVAVSVSMIAAATYAWFTDEANAGDAVFTAGTVDVEVEGVYYLSEVAWDNVNPGDVYELEWVVKNKGTKNIVFMCDIAASMTIAEGREGYFEDHTNYGETMKNLRIGIWDESLNDGLGGYAYPSAENPKELRTGDGNWLLRWEGVDGVDSIYDLNKFKLYYIGASLDGSYDPEDDDVYEVAIKVSVGFDGPATHNGYQGSIFKLGGKVTAVQASNGAPAAVLGDVYDNYQP